MAQSGTVTAGTERIALPTARIGRGRALWQRLRQSKGALVGIVILAVLAIVSVAALTIVLISVWIAATFGVTIGLLACYYGGWVDALLMYVINVMLAVPGILLALAIVTIRGNPNLTNLMIAVGIAGIPTYARLVRGS